MSNYSRRNLLKAIGLGAVGLLPEPSGPFETNEKHRGRKHIKTLRLNWLLILLSLALTSTAQKNLRLESPDGAIQYSFRLTAASPEYSVSYKGQKLIADAGLSLHFQESGPFGANLQISNAHSREGSEQYELIVGKAKQVNDKFRELVIPLKEKAAPNRQINLVVRAFNDGLAFRYEFPQQDNWKTITLTEENSSFRFSGNPKMLALFLPNYTSSHEGKYSSLLVNDVKEDTLIDMPALFEFPGKVYMGITEAALSDYAGMYLGKKNGVLTSKLSPFPGQTEIKVKAELPHKSPWRVLLISNRMGALIESNIITSLNEPLKIEDVSWIKPGKSTFPWWNGTVVPDTNFSPGNNFETNKYYIDFCARNGLEYHSVVEFGGHEWYVNDGGNYQPGPNADVTKTVPGLDMKELCDYAKTVGVGVRVWVHWQALYPKLDEAFAQFEKWGLKGMMVDFMDRDDQEMVNIQEEILQKAAQHKLHIQFHGAYKNTGMHRTYPNEFTREGTLNYEVNKWDTIMDANHDINIPFTRMLAGSTDYHLGGFRAVPASQFKVHYIRPLMQSTRTHMLAMYVVLENYQGMVCDYPEAYEGQPGFEFIKQVPTVWDETKVLTAEPGQYICISRRKGKEWFVGGITNNDSRQSEISFSFLPEGTYELEYYTDAPDSDKIPDHLTKKILTIRNTDKIVVALASGGGTAMYIRPKNE
jgi:alpha-glucosidase